MNATEAGGGDEISVLQDNAVNEGIGKIFLILWSAITVWLMAIPGQAQSEMSKHHAAVRPSGEH